MPSHARNTDQMPRIDPATISRGAVRYRLLLVTTNIGGVDRLLYGEAVEMDEEDSVLTHISSTNTATPGGGFINAEMIRCEVSKADLDQLSDGFKKGSILQAPAAISCGKLVKRPQVILPVAWGMDEDLGTSLHPDQRYTYLLEEWWDPEEGAGQALWETRAISDVGEAIEAAAGIPLHHLWDRIGNFLRFDRLSSWRIDSQPGAIEGERWVRAISDSDPWPESITLHARFLDGQETAVERLLPLTPSGVRISTPSGQSHISLSIFDPVTGELLARQVGGLWTRHLVRSGHTESTQITDSQGQSHIIGWTRWSGGPLDAIDPRNPWHDRPKKRIQRNKQLRERWVAQLFTTGQRIEALRMIREILREESTGFLYVWDPYFDKGAALDVLQWLNPHVPCKVLCGRGNLSGRGPLSARPGLVDLASALQSLRLGPPPRSIECLFRVTQHPNGNLSPVFHDRFLITKNAAWMLGASLNGIGTKPGGLIRLSDPDRLRWMFDDAWAVTPSNATDVLL